jgi:hypothetical protein
VELQGPDLLARGHYPKIVDHWTSLQTGCASVQASDVLLQFALNDAFEGDVPMIHDNAHRLLLVIRIMIENGATVNGSRDLPAKLVVTCQVSEYPLERLGLRSNRRLTPWRCGLDEINRSGALHSGLCRL